MEKQEIEKMSIVIDVFMGKSINTYQFDKWQYHSSWDWLIPVHRKITEIGLWMSIGKYPKLWLEKSKEIDTAILTETTPEKAAILIAQLIKWYNANAEPAR